MRQLYVAALAGILACATVSVAQAADDNDTRVAKEHYKLGLDAYKTGRYPEAIKELKKAYLLKRLPALLLNIGATYRKIGEAVGKDPTVVQRILTRLTKAPGTIDDWSSRTAMPSGDE